MRLGGIAGFLGVPVVAAGCGLALNGLGDTAGADAAGADAAITGDATVRGSDASSSSGADTYVPEAAMSADVLAEASADDSPAPPPVDAGCTGVVCNGFCTGATTCGGCGGANLLCPGTNTCTTDCTACPGSPIQCFACDSNRLNPIGTCQPDNGTTYCLDTNYAGAYQGGTGTHCACTLSSNCVGDTQVCTNVGPAGPLGCFTCGEAYTDGIVCKVGNGAAKCDAMKATCQ
ncbi:MAG: hypothetical protein ABSE49_29570 [Polyangiaceae bacterium]